MRLADAPGTLSLVEFACATVEPGSTIRTDGARMLRRLGERGYTHEYATGYNSLEKASELPGVHLVASLLKRWLAGTLHYRASDKHLAYYVDEYAFRSTVGAPQPLHELINRVVGVDCAQAEMQNTRPSA
jgi:hypothetical protein